MRYINRGVNPVYCSATGSMLSPGSVSSDDRSLMEALEPVVGSISRFGIVLSDAERKALRSILDADTARPKPPPAGSVKSGAGMPVSVEISRIAAIERQKAVSAMLEERRSVASRINSESVFIGPDGRPVDPESGLAERAGARDVEPRIVDDPMSAMDIFSHNAAVAKIRSEAPATGRDAVSARTIPGMPLLPGHEDIERTIASESVQPDPGVPRYTMPSIGPMEPTRMPNVARTDEMVAAAESRGYGRKP